ncbi:MAG: nucleotidyltransferase domain-containing protein [Parabacteroides sp.]|nr:nucleotidyltransferase domain-containing protein [Parabacteroides sp.]
MSDIELRKLRELFARFEPIEEVILYGSRAKGNYKPFSDVDISLVGSCLTRSDLNQISLAIDDLLLPYQFDLSLFYELRNPELKEHIQRVGISIFNRDYSRERSRVVS